MGALGGLVASRIAREFRLGGPSFTISSEDTSGAHALNIAVRLLRQGELDQAIVGAVDLAGDVRAVLATHRLQPFSSSGTVRPLDAQADGTIPGDGAAALVLKRLDDAVRDGDRIYAVVLGIGVASGPDPAAYLAALRRGYAEAAVPPASVGYLEAHGSGRPDEDRREAAALAEAKAFATCALGSSKADVGHTGAAAALAGSGEGRALLASTDPPAAERRRHFATRAGRSRGADSLPSPYFLPRDPQFWLRDRAEGPRRAAVSARESTATSSTSSSKNSSPRRRSPATNGGSLWAHGQPHCSQSKETTRPRFSAGSMPWTSSPRPGPTPPSSRWPDAGGAIIPTTPIGDSVWRWWPTASRCSGTG